MLPVDKRLRSPSKTRVTWGLNIVSGQEITETVLAPVVVVRRPELFGYEKTHNWSLINRLATKSFDKRRRRQRGKG